MKYTFLIPAYKSQFLKEAIESILAQTYKDFDVLVSDDCSPERLDEIVAQFSDPRISYIKNKENIGGKNLVLHWNLLLSKTKSKYCILASDDDVYSPSFLEEIDNLIERYPESYIFRARVNQIDEDGNVVVEEGRFNQFVDNLEYICQMFLPSTIRCIGNYVFDREELVKKGGFVDFPLAWWSDVASCIKMAEKGCINTENILFGFRLSGLNISSNKSKANSMPKVEACLKFDTWLKQYVEKFDSADYRTEILLRQLLMSYNSWFHYMVDSELYCLSASKFNKVCKSMNKIGYSTISEYYYYYYKWHCWKRYGLF